MFRSTHPSPRSMLSLRVPPRQVDPLVSSSQYSWVMLRVATPAAVMLPRASAAGMVRPAPVGVLVLLPGGINPLPSS